MSTPALAGDRVDLRRAFVRHRSPSTRAELSWIWPFRHRAASTSPFLELLATLRPAVAGARWALWALAGGAVPLLVAYAFEWPWQRSLTALFLYPAWLALVAADRQRAAFATVLVAFGLHCLLAISLVAADPAAMTPHLEDASDYSRRQLEWIRGGADAEHRVSSWLPAQALQLAGMALFAFTSLGLVPMLQGLYEIDLMNGFVGHLIRSSDSTFVAILFGWHVWAVARGVAYTRIVYEVTSWSLQRLSGTTLSTRAARRKRWLVGLGFLGLDWLLKLALAEPVRVILARNLTS